MLIDWPQLRVCLLVSVLLIGSRRLLVFNHVVDAESLLAASGCLWQMWLLVLFAVNNQLCAVCFWCVMITRGRSAAAARTVRNMVSDVGTLFPFRSWRFVIYMYCRVGLD